MEYFDCQGACYLICCLLFVLLTNSQEFPEEVNVADELPQIRDIL